MAETCEVWLRWVSAGDRMPREREKVLVMRTLPSGEREVFAGWMSSGGDGIPAWYEYFPKHPLRSMDDGDGFVAERGDVGSADQWKAISRIEVYARDSREENK